MRGIRQFLRLGDRVWQDYREDWGNGVVVEVMTSTIIGGTCLVRILFEDGQQRTFNNDLNSEMCCAPAWACAGSIFLVGAAIAAAVAGRSPAS